MQSFTKIWQPPTETLFALQKCGSASLDEMGNKTWSKKGGEQPASDSIKKGAALFPSVNCFCVSWSIDDVWIQSIKSCACCVKLWSVSDGVGVINGDTQRQCVMCELLAAGTLYPLLCPLSRLNKYDSVSECTRLYDIIVESEKRYYTSLPTVRSADGVNFRWSFSIHIHTPKMARGKIKNLAV